MKLLRIFPMKRGTVEPRLSELVGTLVNSPDNRASAVFVQKTVALMCSEKLGNYSLTFYSAG